MTCMFIKSDIRSGFCGTSLRYAKANCPEMGDNFCADQPNEYPLYVDANNLYGTAISHPLPYKEFYWLSAGEIKSPDIMQIPDDNDTGYIFEVDLQYPRELHNIHNDFPYYPERLSPSLKLNSTPKLIANLLDKNKYVIHYVYLKSAFQSLGWC